MCQDEANVKISYIAANASFDIVVEQFLQAEAHFSKSPSRYRSHTSAHSSQMPTHNKAIWLAFLILFFNACNVPKQICAHSSSTCTVRSDDEILFCDKVINRFSQFSQASIQACVGVLATVIF